MKPFTELMELILSPLKSAAAQGAQNLASSIGTTVQLGITLYIILYGWQVARGEIAEPWNEFAKRAVKLGVIVALIQSTGIYQEYVIDFLAGSLPDALSNALSNKPIPDASTFDSLANQVAILLTQIWQGTGWSAPAATARAAVVTLLVMPFLWCALIVGFVVTLWAKAGMYFVATLGPLFIALGMFEQTRKYLHNWLDQIVSMIALQVLVALTCGLVIQGLEKATKSAPTPENVFALAGQVIVLAVFSLAIWSSLPRLASKLGGYGASLAGAGSRAAPMETMRAPLASFNEHGAPPSGRPELASISPRGGDAARHNPAITPSPIVGGDAPSETRQSSAGASGMAEGSRMEPLPRPSTSTSASQSEPTSPDRSNSAPSSAGWTPAPMVQSTPSNAFDNGLAVNSVGTDIATSLDVPRLTPAADGTPQVSATASSKLAEATPVSAPENDFSMMLAEQQTGFEGMNFEGPAHRAADARSLVSAAPVPIANSLAGEPNAATADANQTIVPSNRRPS